MKNLLFLLFLLLSSTICFAQNDDAKRAYNKGLALYHQTSYAEAITHLSEAVEHFDAFEAAHQLLAICFDETNQLNKSIAHYEQVVDINPSNKKAMFNLSKQYQRNKDYDSAKAILNKALTVDPSYVKAKTELTEIDRILKDGGKVEEDPIYYKANVLFKQKKYNEAIQQLMPLNARAPSANSLYLEGLCQEKQGDLNEAASRYQAAAFLDPKYIDAHIRMGIISYNQQNYEAAAMRFKDVIQLEEEPSEEFSYYLGNCLYRIESYEEATNHLNDAILLDPNSGRAHFTLHKVYEKLDKEDKSIIHRIRAEELGYDGRYEDTTTETKTTTTTTTTTTTETPEETKGETTETITKRQGPTVKGMTKEPVSDEPKLSKKEQKEADKKAKLELKAKDKANKELRKKQRKNPTYRD